MSRSCVACRSDRRLAALRTKLNANQQAALTVILERRRIGLDDLREALGMKNNNNVGGVVAGIVKNLKRAGIRGELVFTRTVSGYGRGRAITYTCGPTLAMLGPKK